MSQIKISYSISNICTAFDFHTIGSKVIDKESFIEGLLIHLNSYDTSRDKVPGQHFVVLPKEFYHTVSAGDGLKSKDERDYVIRSHREGPKMFLCREKAGEVNFLGVVVYTKEAYFNDPDVDEAEKELFDSDVTHIIVAVIASSARRTGIDDLEAYVDRIIGKAKEVKEYWDKYSVVAD